MTDVGMPFKESQIICLEHEATCLYGEVIQLIPARGMCWFRPICMTVSNIKGDGVCDERYDLIRLRSSSDLLWPTTLFRSALDTEVISLLVDSDDSTQENLPDRNAWQPHSNIASVPSPLEDKELSKQIAPAIQQNPVLSAESGLQGENPHKKAQQERSTSRQRLNQFIREVWAANQDKF